MQRTAKNSNVVNSDYIPNGVTISPSIPTAGEKVKVIYDGLLSKNGATGIYAHVGYGNRWDNVNDYQMNKTGMGFEVSVPVIKSDSLNVCFRDYASNWDNNSGKNYSFDVVQ